MTKPQPAATKHRFFSLLPDNPNLPFMKYRKYAYALSLAFLLATVGWILVKGVDYSVDFTGGTLLQLQASPPVPADAARSALASLGLGGAEVQTVGTGEELLIRMEPQPDSVVASIATTIEARNPGTKVELRRQETVGPRIGAELRQKAILAVLLSLAGMLLYVGIRYEFKFAIGAVIAIFHDVFAAFGVLLFLDREISLTVLAALLTLAGYSVNDTIVVFDRIRERGKQLHKLSHEDVMNTAMNETLSRTMITSVTVFLACLALYFFGGAVINDFALTMLAGVLFGTYSSIYVASALALDIWNWIDRKKTAGRKAQAA